MQGQRPSDIQFIYIYIYIHIHIHIHICGFFYNHNNNHSINKKTIIIMIIIKVLVIVTIITMVVYISRSGKRNRETRDKAGREHMVVQFLARSVCSVVSVGIHGPQPQKLNSVIPRSLWRHKEGSSTNDWAPARNKKESNERQMRMLRCEFPCFRPTSANIGDLLPQGVSDGEQQGIALYLKTCHLSA